MARPQSYDADHVVDQALSQFWAEGFRQCDVEKLTRAAHVNRHSLYKAFGGKKGLFDSALTRYVDTIAADFMAGLEQGTGIEAILAYFGRALDILGGAPDDALGRRGCFITNTMVEMGDSDAAVSAIISRYHALIEAGFRQAVERGQRDGSIRPELDAGDTARWLMLTSQGLSVSARFGSADSGILRAVQGALGKAA